MSIESRRHQYGTVFMHWQIQEVLGIGSGGKTAVFRLKRIDSSRGQSALKVINLIEERGNYESRPESLKREYEAVREECMTSALEEVWLMDEFQGNTNIVDYLDHQFVNWADESGFGCDMLIRMELLKDLRSEIQTGKIYTEEEIVKLGCDICRALVLCHRKGILHRDIKPENIFVNRNDDYKLGDFGISRIIGVAPTARASTGIGTLEYAAPEQISGKYDKRVDIYSLGLVLYELGNQNHLPFAKSTYVRSDDVNRRMSGTPLPSPCGVSKELADIILRACAFKPEDRFQTADDFLAALTHISAKELPERPVVVKEDHLLQASYSTVPAVADAPQLYPGNVTQAADTLAAKENLSYETVPAGDLNAPLDSGTPDELNELGNRYYYGNGVVQDYEKAVEYYTTAANRGHAWAQYSLGFCFCHGKGVQQNFDIAVEWYRKAASQNIPWAQNELGDCYFYGRGVNQNYELAVEWYKKAAHAEDASALFNLGRCYQFGKGVTSDSSTAFRYYSRASEKGHAAALYHLGLCYFAGDGTQRDFNKAFQVFDKVTNLGFNDALTALALCYYYGRGTEQDYMKAVEFAKKAADNNDSSAQCLLGEWYLAGKGVTQDDAMAIIWLAKAADNDNAAAQRLLSECYFTGKGITQNNETALKWLTKAAKAGDSAAQLTLGKRYYSGEGVKQDYLKAAIWLITAESNALNKDNSSRSEQFVLETEIHLSIMNISLNNNAWKRFESMAREGNAGIQYHLGNYYLAKSEREHGLFTRDEEAESLITAVTYFTSAKQQGHLRAAAELEKILKNRRLTKILAKKGYSVGG